MQPKGAKVCSQRGRNLPNLYTLITPYDSSHITQAMYDPHLTQYESFVPQLQSNIRIGSGTQHTHGIVTPFIPGSFPLSPHHAHEPTWLLPILLARRRQHSRDQQHGRDEWASGKHGASPEARSRERVLHPALRCVALRWRWSMPVPPQASTIIPGEPGTTAPEEELPGIGRGWASPFCHVRPAFPGKGGLRKVDPRGCKTRKKIYGSQYTCNPNVETSNTLERV